MIRGPGTNAIEKLLTQKYPWAAIPGWDATIWAANKFFNCIISKGHLNSLLFEILSIKSNDLCMLISVVFWLIHFHCCIVFHTLVFHHYFFTLNLSQISFCISIYWSLYSFSMATLKYKHICYWTRLLSINIYVIAILQPLLPNNTVINT